MRKPETTSAQYKNGIVNDQGQKGTAIVIPLFVLPLLSVFVAFAVSRTTAETVAVGNEASEARTQYAAQGSLETMTRNFNKIFETKLNPAGADITQVETALVPGLSTAVGGDYVFDQRVLLTSNLPPTVLSGGPYSGLYALHDNWRLRTTATNQRDGTQIQLTRSVLNNRIPIFQFGVFYEDDLELFNGPAFGFGGRVHSNRHFFLHPSSNGAYFDSRVTAHGHIVTQIKRNGDTVNITAALTQIKNASGVYKRLDPDKGSVLNGAPNVFGAGQFADPQLPSSALNPNWDTQSSIFDGNLQARTKRLNLPLKVGANTDLIEMIRRGKEPPPAVGGGDLVDNAGVLEPVVAGPLADNLIMRAERFANKTGIRVSLADSKAKLPGCALGVGIAPVAGQCGVRLDGDLAGADPAFVPNPADPILAARARGYRPRPMRSFAAGLFDHQATRVNGDRLFTGGARQVWIKIETVRTDPATNLIVTQDITEDILSLGMSEQAPAWLNLAGYNHTPLTTSITNSNPQPPPTNGTDSRSIIKVQRFVIPGPQIANYTGGAAGVHTYSVGNGNYVRRFTAADAVKIAAGCPVAPAPTPCIADDSGNPDATVNPNVNNERFGHLRLSGLIDAVVPFPIKMFDTREGLYYDEKSTAFYSTANFDNYRRVPRNGVMSMIDIDVANLRRFLRGDFNGLFPVNTPYALRPAGGPLVNTDIPQNAGWVFYVSDRRGDADFDGEFDMEDIYGADAGNDVVMQPGEDLDILAGTVGNGVLENRTCFVDPVRCETERYRDNAVYVDAAAVVDHKYYRRGVRLVNGSTLPGVYDSATPSNTRGFTVASENGVYVKGNYNATGIGVVPGTGHSTYDQYFPFNTQTHIPASVVSDAVTILSNGWDDAESFVFPWDVGSRNATTTQMRFAMLAGDTLTSMTAAPNQGGGDPRLNGGLHNFKRFLEDWSAERLDYTGSLINLYNSRNNNGAFKCCNTVYSPPRRNWVFDSTFLDPNRIPPGTPFFQYVQTTGFERSTE